MSICLCVCLLLPPGGYILIHINFFSANLSNYPPPPLKFPPKNISSSCGSGVINPFITKCINCVISLYSVKPLLPTLFMRLFAFKIFISVKFI